MEKNQVKVNQNIRIIRYLKSHGTITSLEAMNELGVMRLASRISNLRQQGHKITSQYVSRMNRFGETCRVKQYTLGDEDE